VKTTPPILYLFAGSNGAGKTTFARAYLRQMDPIPRFLNADEIARGLSPLEPQRLAVKAGNLLIHEIQDSIESGVSFGLESTLSGTTHAKLLKQARRPAPDSEQGRKNRGREGAESRRLRRNPASLTVDDGAPCRRHEWKGSPVSPTSMAAEFPGQQFHLLKPLWFMSRNFFNWLSNRA
jgi:hypothetical protein